MCTKKEFQKRSLISNKCVGRSIHHWECCAKNANWHQCSVTTNFKAIREASKNHMTFFTTKKAFHHPNFFSILKRHFLCENFSTFRFRFSRKHNHYVNLVIYMIWKFLVVRKKKWSTLSFYFLWHFFLYDLSLLMCLYSPFAHLPYRSSCQIFFHYTSLSRIQCHTARKILNCTNLIKKSSLGLRFIWICLSTSSRYIFRQKATSQHNYQNCWNWRHQSFIFLLFAWTDETSFQITNDSLCYFKLIHTIAPIANK